MQNRIQKINLWKAGCSWKKHGASWTAGLNLLQSLIKLNLLPMQFPCILFCYFSIFLRKSGYMRIWNQILGPVCSSPPCNSPLSCWFPTWQSPGDRRWRVRWLRPPHQRPGWPQRTSRSCSCQHRSWTTACTCLNIIHKSLKNNNRSKRTFHFNTLKLKILQIGFSVNFAHSIKKQNVSNIWSQNVNKRYMYCTFGH